MMLLHRFWAFAFLLAFFLMPGVSVTEAHMLTTARLESLNFISSDYENTQQKNYAFLGVNLRTVSPISKGVPQTQIFNLDIDAAYAFGQPVLNYANIKEIYFLQSIEDLNLTYGRRLSDWSSLEKNWNLGFFQPQFRWNSLSVQAQGNFGIGIDNIDLKTPRNFSFAVFGSPIYLPDQGPGYELKEGRFQSSNPWFSAPPQNVEFNGQLLPIDYNIVVPETSDVVFQSVYGGRLSYEFDSGYYVKASYLSTPSHQMALTYKAVLVADRVKADIVPVTYREQIAAFDVGYAHRMLGWGVSFLSNQPEKISAKFNYNYPEIKSSLAWGPEAYLNWENFKINVSGLFVEGGQTIDHGPDAAQMSHSLTSKYNYRSAYKIKAMYNILSSLNLDYQFNTEWLQSFNQVTRILKLGLNAKIYQSWNLFVNAILVETSDEINNVSHLRNLDQAWIGASYEF